MTITLLMPDTLLSMPPYWPVLNWSTVASLLRFPCESSNNTRDLSFDFRQPATIYLSLPASTKRDQREEEASSQEPLPGRALTRSPSLREREPSLRSTEHPRVSSCRSAVWLADPSFRSALVVLVWLVVPFSRSSHLYSTIVLVPFSQYTSLLSSLHALRL